MSSNKPGLLASYQEAVRKLWTRNQALETRNRELEQAVPPLVERANHAESQLGLLQRAYECLVHDLRQVESEKQLAQNRVVELEYKLERALQPCPYCHRAVVTFTLRREECPTTT